MDLLWTTGDTWMLVTVGVLLSLSGFFALSETALVRMTRTRAQSLVDDRKRGAHALVRLIEAPEKFLNPLLLLILICQLVSATLVGILAERLFHTAGLIVSTAFEVVIIFVFFEAMPKNYAVQYADRSAVIAAPVVEAILKFWPIRWISYLLLTIARVLLKPFGVSDGGQKVTESEILAMANVAVSDKAIEKTERDFIHSVIEFGDTIAREIMVPRIDMQAIDGELSVREAYDHCLAVGRTRLPVLGEGVDDVTGLVSLRLLARLVAEGKGDERVGENAGLIYAVPETKKVSLLLKQFQHLRSHLFVVVDEYGGTAGIITLEDVIEELVGDIDDEVDIEREDKTRRSAEDEPTLDEDEGDPVGPFLVSGRLNIDDADDDFKINLPKGGWDTVGGLVMDLAAGVPEVGDRVESEHYRFLVVAMDGRRIEEVEISLRVDEDDE